MVNNKGYLKTLEAVIAILILFIFISVIMPRPKQTEAATPQNVLLLQDKVLDEIESNNTLRTAVLNKDATALDNFVKSLNIPPQYGYTILICSKDVCPLPQLPRGTVYVGNRVIATNYTSYTYGLVKFYLWNL